MKKKKAKKGEQCCWCVKTGTVRSTTVYVYKIKMTSGRIANKRFHVPCLHEMLNFSPTKRGARLYQKGVA